MSIKYVCRHCKITIGELASMQASESQLGFHFLTPEERKDIIAYSPNGDITVNLTCEYCHDIYIKHPELALIPNPLQ